MASLVVLVTAVIAAAAYHATALEREYRTQLDRGDAALRADQTYTALEAYSGAIALRPDSVLAHLRRAETYQRRGEIDEAARDLRTAAALDPTATRPLDELGDVMYQRQRYHLAIEMYENCLKLDERSPRVQYKLALARYRDGDVNGTIAAVRQALRLDDLMADAHYLLGLSLRDKRRVAEAEQSFEQAVALDPRLVAAREELADVYGSANRRTDEVRQLEAIASIERDRVDRQIAVALAHARNGNADLAVVTLGHALERAADRPPVYAALGKLWFEIASTRKDHPEALVKAIDAFEHTAGTPAATSDVLTAYGRALMQAGQVELADRVLQQATVTFPVDPAAFLASAAVAERLDDAGRARHALIAFTVLVPDDPEFATRAAHIAALSIRMDDNATAVDWLRKAVNATPSDAKLLGALADAQLRNADVDGARQTLARALEKDPENPQLIALARKIR